MRSYQKQLFLTSYQLNVMYSLFILFLTSTTHVTGRGKTDTPIQHVNGSLIIDEAAPQIICTGTGRFPDEHCNKYRKCYGTVPARGTPYTCHKGNNWDSMKEQCIPNNPCGSFNCIKPNSFTAHTVYKQFYAKCVDGGKPPIVYRCPGNYEYYDATQACVPPGTTMTSTTSKSLPTTTEHVSSPETICTGSGRFPDEQCNKYRKCYGTVPARGTPYTCHKGNNWDAMKEQCIPNNPCGSFYCVKPNTFTAHTVYKQFYAKCVEGGKPPIVYRCSGNYEYYDATQACEPTCNGVKDVNFEDLNDCSKYFRCQNPPEFKLHLDCPPGQAFDKNAKVCSSYAFSSCPMAKPLVTTTTTTTTTTIKPLPATPFPLTLTKCTKQLSPKCFEALKCKGILAKCTYEYIYIGSKTECKDEIESLIKQTDSKPCNNGEPTSPTKATEKPTTVSSTPTATNKPTTVTTTNKPTTVTTSVPLDHCMQQLTPECRDTNTPKIKSQCVTQYLHVSTEPGCKEEIKQLMAKIIGKHH